MKRHFSTSFGFLRQDTAVSRVSKIYSGSYWTGRLGRMFWTRHRKNRIELAPVRGILSNGCRCPHRMADESNEPKNQTRSYVYNTAWKSLRDELKPNNAPATVLRRKLMAMVLAAGSYAVIDTAPNFFAKEIYQELLRVDVNSGEWKNARWSIFFRSRGAILLLQEDIIAFLLSSEIMDSGPLSYTLNAEQALNSFTDPSFASRLRIFFQFAPVELQKSLETATQMLEIIGQPSNDAIQVLKEYDRHIRVLRTQTNQRINPTERQRSHQENVQQLSALHSTM